MSRFWRAVPPLVRVTTQAESPVSFEWQGRLHAIISVRNRWLIERDWWRREVSRDTFLIVTNTGLCAEIFHDLVADTWHLQRLYD